jgi:hypothetical protein
MRKRNDGDSRVVVLVWATTRAVWGHATLSLTFFKSRRPHINRSLADYEFVAASRYRLTQSVFIDDVRVYRCVRTRLILQKWVSKWDSN